MLTGKYTHATGVTLLFTPFQDSRNETIAEHLSKNSFKTALVGKSHFNEWIWGPRYADDPLDFGFQTFILEALKMNIYSIFIIKGYNL